MEKNNNKAIIKEGPFDYGSANRMRRPAPSTTPDYFHHQAYRTTSNTPGASGVYNYYSQNAEGNFKQMFLPIYNTVTSSLKELSNIAGTDVTMLTSKMMVDVDPMEIRVNAPQVNNNVQQAITEIRQAVSALAAAKDYLKMALMPLGVKKHEDFAYYKMQESIDKVVNNFMDNLLKEIKE